MIKCWRVCFLFLTWPFYYCRVTLNPLIHYRNHFIPIRMDQHCTLLNSYRLLHYLKQMIPAFKCSPYPKMLNWCLELLQHWPFFNRMFSGRRRLNEGFFLALKTFPRWPLKMIYPRGAIARIRGLCMNQSRRCHVHLTNPRCRHAPCLYVYTRGKIDCVVWIRNPAGCAKPTLVTLAHSS